MAPMSALFSAAGSTSHQQRAPRSTKLQMHIFIFVLGTLSAMGSPFWLLMLPASMFLVFDWST